MIIILGVKDRFIAKTIESSLHMGLNIWIVIWNHSKQ